MILAIAVVLGAACCGVLWLAYQADRVETYGPVCPACRWPTEGALPCLCPAPGAADLEPGLHTSGYAAPHDSERWN